MQSFDMARYQRRRRVSSLLMIASWFAAVSGLAILAFILGKSLRSSMQLSGIAALPYREAVGLLTE